MIDVDIKRPSLEVRIKLADIVHIKVNGDGTYSSINTAMGTWEYASVGMFGKMLSELDEAEKLELDQYADSDIREFANKVRVELGNPTTS